MFGNNLCLENQSSYKGIMLIFYNDEGCSINDDEVIYNGFQEDYSDEDDESSEGDDDDDPDYKPSKVGSCFVVLWMLIMEL